MSRVYEVGKDKYLFDHSSREHPNFCGGDIWHTLSAGPVTHVVTKGTKVKSIKEAAKDYVEHSMYAYSVVVTDVVHGGFYLNVIKPLPAKWTSKDGRTYTVKRSPHTLNHGSGNTFVTCVITKSRSARKVKSK